MFGRLLSLAALSFLRATQAETILNELQLNKGLQELKTDAKHTNLKTQRKLTTNPPSASTSNKTAGSLPDPNAVTATKNDQDQNSCEKGQKANSQSSRRGKCCNRTCKILACILVVAMAVGVIMLGGCIYHILFRRKKKNKSDLQTPFDMLGTIERPAANTPQAHTFNSMPKESEASRRTHSHTSEDLRSKSLYDDFELPKSSADYARQRGDEAKPLPSEYNVWQSAMEPQEEETDNYSYLSAMEPQDDEVNNYSYLSARHSMSVDDYSTDTTVYDRSPSNNTQVINQATSSATATQVSDDFRYHSRMTEKSDKSKSSTTSYEL